jgi:maleylacetoacetate isomerase
MGAAPSLRLYHYWRSTSSWRVRFAFAAKGIPCELIAVNLLENESEGAEHLVRNPMGYVPVLELKDAPAGAPRYLAESLAIIHWAEETFTDVPLLPGDAWQRGRIWQLAELINAGTQPLVNLGVGARHSADEAEQKLWNQHWLRKGLEAYERLVRETAGRLSVGDRLTLADICLIPQCYSAARNDVRLDDYPTIRRINEEALRLESCIRSHPDRYSPGKPASIQPR